MYKNKEIEEIVIQLRKKRNNGELNDEQFTKLRHSCELMFTSLNAFLKSIDDNSYSQSDCTDYLKQYMDESQKFEQAIKQ